MKFQGTNVETVESDKYLGIHLKKQPGLEQTLSAEEIEIFEM